MNPVVHFEMPAVDKQRMSNFYSNVFGWQLEHLGPEMGEYTLARTTEVDESGFPKTPGTINGGFFTKTADNQYPSIVISVDDIQAAMKAITTAGGTVLGGAGGSEPDMIPGVGLWCRVVDTEGNHVSILQSIRD